MSQFGGNSRTYFSRNYNSALELLVPDFYLAEEVTASGVRTDVVDQVINSHLKIAIDADFVFNISATNNFNLKEFSGISPYLIKQNNLTKISSFDFESKILYPLGRTYSEFATSGEFQDYLNTDLLPRIVLNSNDLAVSTLNAFASDSSGTHEFLISTLSWYYFLNQAGAWSNSPSGLVSRDLARTCYAGETLELADAMKAVNEYLWDNYTEHSYCPDIYVSGSTTYTSGTQTLDNYNTITQIIYRNSFFDKKDNYVKEAVENYLTLNSLLSNTEVNGPLSKFLKAVGYSVADSQTEVENIRTLFDIENCPEQFLPQLAELIGWKLIGSNPDRWRRQLRGAVEIYKAKGTKRSIQLIVNTIFGDDVYDVSSSNIVELYESYIPNLIYYALATDSLAFADDGNNWTQQTAQNMGVEEFSRKGVDTNIRLAVDYILLDIVTEFPNLFYIGTEPFRVGDPDFVFYYRDRDFPIPPWEEEKYYQNSNITNQFLDYLYERLRCFGVSDTLALGIRDYIEEHTLNVNVAYSTESQWLFFTSSIQYPTNYSEVLGNPSTKRAEYLPLWNGRSSHFSMLFDATSFDFSKIKDEATDSPLAIRDILLGVDQVVPAHSIPNAILSLTDAEENVSGVIAPYFSINTVTDECFVTSSQVGSNYGVSGADMSTGSKAFKRGDVDNMNDALFQTDAIAVPRNSLRRRNYKNLLPKENFYMRDGFNMPHSFDPSVLEYADVNGSSVAQVHLGYNFSAGAYTPIPDAVSSLPAVYSICNGLTSPNIINGIAVSATFPSRGRRTNYEASAYTNRTDRMESPRIQYIMFSLQDRALWKEASALVETSSIDASSWFDWVGSKYGEISQLSPSTFSFYEDFKFGRGIHQIYRDYIEYFNSHSLSENRVRPRVADDSIIDYVYGPYLRNSLLDYTGQAVINDPSLVSSSLGDINFFTTNDTFSSSSTSIGTIVSGSEFINSHILSGVQFVMPSGTASNKMAMINVSASFQQSNRSSYHVNNPIVYFRSVNGLPRLIFNDSNISTSKNLIPERDFNVEINTLGGHDNGLELNGYSIGAVVRTGMEDNENIWIFNREGIWERIPLTQYTYNNILGRFSHIQNYPPTIIEVSGESTGSKCIDLFVSSIDTTPTPITLQNLTEDKINTFTFRFNTKNLPIAIPDDYYSQFGQLHRFNQNYIIEIFMIPNSANDKRYMLLDNISLRDQTNYVRADVSFDGVSSASSFSVKLERSEMLGVFRYFNDIADNKASRIAADTSGMFEVSGGGRLNYRINPDWVGSRDSLGVNNLSSIDFNGV